MRVIQHSTNNDVLGAPRGNSVEECRPAPITRSQYADGTNSITTYWEPSALERQLIASGSKVRVEVIGTTMPPMLVTADE